MIISDTESSGSATTGSRACWVLKLEWIFQSTNESICTQEQGPLHVPIGVYDMSTEILTINTSIVLDWGPYNWTYQEDTNFPYHRCSDPCPPANFKVAGDQFCCWQCFQCRINEILVDNETSCEVCPDKQWPAGEDQLECVSVPHTYLTWGNLYGAILTGLAGFGLLLTLLLSTVTAKKKHLRVVKGSGLQMLFVIMFGIYLAFASVFAHIEKPNDALCIFGRTGFHLSFTLIFGPMLVKTNRVFQVFFAASKLSRKVFMGSELSQQLALSTIIAIQVMYRVPSQYKGRLAWYSNFHYKDETVMAPSRIHNRHTHGPLYRYAKLRVAHAQGMPGTFSQLPTWKETAS